MSDEIEFRVWIGCLACYNEGRLIGQWYDATEAGEVTTQDLHANEGIVTDKAGYVQGKEIYGPHEELWCFDVEAPVKEWAREMSPMEASKLAADFEEATGALDNCPWQAYLQWLAARGEQPSWDTASEAEDRYHGEWTSFRDYADDWADQVMNSDPEPEPKTWDLEGRARKERSEFMGRYFNWEAHARDMQHDFDVYDSDTGVYIFHIA